MARQHAASDTEILNMRIGCPGRQPLFLLNGGFVHGNPIQTSSVDSIVVLIDQDAAPYGEVAADGSLSFIRRSAVK